MKKRAYYLQLNEIFELEQLILIPARYHVGDLSGKINVENREDLKKKYHMHLEGDNALEVINKAKELCKQHKEVIKE